MVAIVIKSIDLDKLVVGPAANKPRVLLDAPSIDFLTVVKSPKFVASPVVAIVIYCMTLVRDGVPPPAETDL